ncbi:MAG: hypothetical protein JO013_07615 [Alphaproteobacteria bacterium]|nr:hypothetical protein [Alphaproteobacteria bacterium]
MATAAIAAAAAAAQRRVIETFRISGATSPSLLLSGNLRLIFSNLDDIFVMPSPRGLA